jgi:hypothetical protein
MEAVMRYTLVLALLLGIRATSALGQVDTLSLEQISSFSTPNYIEQIYFEDINQDGIKEIITCGRVGTVYVYNPFDGALIWSSPYIPQGNSDSRLEFADMNNDGDIDLAVKDTSYLKIFDVVHDSLIWTSPNLIANPTTFGLGDRNSDGFNDVIIVSRNPLDYEEGDVAWIDIYDGPSFPYTRCAEFPVWYSHAYHSEYYGYLYEAELLGKTLVADISSDQGIQCRIIVFLPFHIWNYWWDGAFWIDVNDWYGRYRLIDPLTLNVTSIIGSGNLVSYSIIENVNNSYLYLYTRANTALSTTDWNGGNRTTSLNNYNQIECLSADSLISNIGIWDYISNWPETRWSYPVIGDIDPANDGDEICYGAQDSLKFFSYPIMTRLMSIRVDSVAFSKVCLFHSASLFGTPQILCNRPLMAINGTDGNLSAVFPNERLQPSTVIDLNNDGEDEILEYSRNYHYINIYHVFNPLNAINDNAGLLPSSYRLYANYPNPFNASTVIKYDLPKASDVSIDIYDILGRKVENLLSEKQPAGSHSITWNVGDVPSGIYFYKIKAGNYSETKKCLFLK